MKHTNKLINSNGFTYNQLQLPSRVTSGVLHGEKDPPSMRGWFIIVNVTVANSCVNVLNSNAKVMHLKSTNCKMINSTARASNTSWCLRQYYIVHIH